MKDHINSIYSFKTTVSDISALFRRTRYGVTIVKELRFFHKVLTLGTDALVLGRGRYDHIMKIYYFFAWTIFFASYRSSGEVVQSIHLTCGKSAVRYPIATGSESPTAKRPTTGVNILGPRRWPLKRMSSVQIGVARQTRFNAQQVECRAHIIIYFKL